MTTSSHSTLFTSRLRRSLVQNIFFFTLVVSLLSILPAGASSQEIDCLTCHRKLKNEKVVHAALDMGCTSCHTGIDAKKVPHRKTNKIAKGLSAEQPELCYGCHDMALFTKTNVHAAVGMGCTGCHNPHSSKIEKLLRADGSELCLTCHDAAPFSKKQVHAPVAGGMCVSCHSPHSSDFMAILVKKPYDLCLDCHSEVTKKPHAIVGFGSARHPLGEQKKDKKGELKDLMDPARPDKPFYCGSCHDPHSTDVNKLLRFNARSGMDLCTHCHKM